MNILIATCKQLPSFEKDDEPLYECLLQNGASFSIVPWDEIHEADGFDACLIRTTWDYVERQEEFLDWVSMISTKVVLVNPAELIRWNIDKRYLQYFHERGVPIAPTIWMDTPLDLKEMMREKTWEKGFIKPVIGACAVDTFRFSMDNIEEAQRFLDETATQQKMMLQPYLHRVETLGEYSAIYFGECFSHAVRKIPVPGDYRVQDDYGASDERIEASDELRELAELVISQIPYPWLYARVDALVMDDDTWVLNELEMIEPSLFFRHAEQAPQSLYESLVDMVSGASVKAE